MKKAMIVMGDKLQVTYTLTKEHIRTLFLIKANEGVAEFENRDPNLYEDVDGNEMSWKVCDDLLEMGLLDEDEESFDVYFELNSQGEDIIDQLSKQKK